MVPLTGLLTMTVLRLGREADMALTQLAAALPTDVMPGEADPASAALPQQPMHRCLFQAAASFNTFRPATNPHDFALGGVRFLGSSVQNVDDEYKCAGSIPQAYIMDLRCLGSPTLRLDAELMVEYLPFRCLV